MRGDIDNAGQDQGERLAVTAGTYVRYVAERGAGFNVIFSGPLSQLEESELSEAGRRLISLLLELAERVLDAPRPDEALLVLERHIVSAHGYVTLHRDGFFSGRRPKDTVESITERATQATRDLLRLSC
jgi:Tetracyclin repressor-like, C-terminal domain